ncbi:MAG: hypothetical protein ABFS30_16910 [Pseudomonadota bacterium]
MALFVFSILLILAAIAAFFVAKERQKARRKEIEATGIARFQQIVTQGISDRLLQRNGIQATMKLAECKNAKVVIVGGKDGLPLILNTEPW